MNSVSTPELNLNPYHPAVTTLKTAHSTDHISSSSLPVTDSATSASDTAPHCHPMLFPLHTSCTQQIEDASLPTPPGETNFPAKQATIYFPAPVHPEAIQYAKSRFGQVITSQEMDRDQAWNVCHGVVNRANPITSQTIEKAPKLCAISIVGVGYDTIDIPACREKDVAVMNCPGANSSAVAELTLALTLWLLRRVAELDRRLRSGEKMLSIDNLGKGLKGKIVGMIGMGDTARKAAELFHHAFNCPIHIFSPTSPATRWTSHDPNGTLPHTRHTSLSNLLPLVDILTLHCPLTVSTRDLISDKELAIMKEGSILVNMSRGAVVNEGALAEALKIGKTIGGAASDVFKHEPAHKDDVAGLLDLDNFIGTPHIGGSTVEAQIDVCLLAIDQLAGYFDGYQIHNRVC
ncbi:hypothetical protein IAR55_003307 [Kwoniella newhampshirensis]|uniref:Phosphoglycerate dehydrogenase n=1 Tax=Kwoniella newhampshirensis TaxID=1651941 RepID=A0AAW0Z1B7_9TREE